MTLLDLISVIDDNCKVAVWSYYDNELLTAYDGKDSIDYKYNNCEVLSVSAGKNSTIDILIDY